MPKLWNLTVCILTTLCLIGTSSNSNAQPPETKDGIPKGPQTTRDGSPQESLIWYQLFENKFVSAVTADEKNQTPNFNKVGAYQSSGSLYISSFKIDGGQQTLSGEKAYDFVCKGEVVKTFNLCKNGKKPEEIRAWEAAALSFGLPAAALMCLAAHESVSYVEQASPANPNGNKERRPPEQTAEQLKANSKQMKKANQVYYRLIGAKVEPDKSGNIDPEAEPPLSGEKSSALSKARKYRGLFNQLELSITQANKNALGNSDFFDLLRILAIGTKSGDEANRYANQLALRSEPKTPIQIPPDKQKFLKGFMDCVCGSETAVGATGDCKTGVK